MIYIRKDSLGFFIGFIPFLMFFTIFYSGDKSDWKTYKYFVDNCHSFGCTYFEPGYDAVTYFASLVGGFWFIRLLLFVSGVATVFFISRIFQSSLTISSSIFLATLFPLYLGAIRQALAASFVFASVFLIRGSVRMSLFSFTALSVHFSGFVGFVLFALRRFYHRKPIVLLAYCLLPIIYYVSLRVGRLGLSSDFAQSDFASFKEFVLLFERFIVVCVVAFLFWVKRSSFDTGFLFIILWGVVWFFLFYADDRNMAGRMAIYFRVFEMFAYLAFLRYFRFSVIFFVLVVVKVFFTLYGAVWF